MFYKCPQFPVEKVPLGMNMCWSGMMLGSAPRSSISKTPSRATYFIFFFPSEDIGWHLALVQGVRLLQPVDCRVLTLLWAWSKSVLEWRTGL